MNVDQTNAKESTIPSTVFDKTRPTKSRSVRQKPRRSPYSMSTPSTAAPKPSCEYPPLHDYHGTDRSSPLYDYTAAVSSSSSSSSSIYDVTTTPRAVQNTHDCLVDSRYFYPQSYAAANHHPHPHPGIYYDQSAVIGLYSYPAAAAAAAYQRYYDESVASSYYRSDDNNKYGGQTNAVISGGGVESDYMETGSDVSSCVVRRLPYGSFSAGSGGATVVRAAPRSQHLDDLGSPPSTMQSKGGPPVVALLGAPYGDSSCAKAAAASKRVVTAAKSSSSFSATLSEYSTKNSYAGEGGVRGVGGVGGGGGVRSPPEDDYFAKAPSTETKAMVAPPSEEYERRRTSTSIRQVALQSNYTANLRSDCERLNGGGRGREGRDRESVLRGAGAAAAGDGEALAGESTACSLGGHQQGLLLSSSYPPSSVQPSVIIRRGLGSSKTNDLRVQGHGDVTDEPPDNDETGGTSSPGELTPPADLYTPAVQQKGGATYPPYRAHHQDKAFASPSGYFQFGYAGGGGGKYCGGQGASVVGGPSGEGPADQRYNTSQPGYTSVIVDAQQFYVTNGYVH